MPVSYKRIIDGIKIGKREGSFGTAALKRKSVVVENILVDDKWVKFQKLASEYGFAACWATPIVSSSDKVMGMFDVYYATPFSPSPSDLTAMELAGHLAAITLELYGAGVPDDKGSGNSAFFRLDSDWTITAVNGEATRFLGRSRDEVIGKNLWDLYPEYVGSVYHREYERAIREKVTVAFETFSQRFLSRVLVTAHPQKTGLAVFFRTLPH